MKRTVTPAVLILLASLTSACVSGRPETTSYTSPATGQTTVFQSDREMCESACNSDYTRCMETSAAQDKMPGMPVGMFGASGQCRDELSSCLPSCRSR